MKNVHDLVNEFTNEVVELCAAKGYDLSEGSEFGADLDELQDNLLREISELIHKVLDNKYT